MRMIGVLLLILTVAFPVFAGGNCTRIVAVGDLHGGYDAFVTILKEVELIDAELRWIGGGACLVQLGDIVDRGARSRDVLDLLMDLERQAADQVRVLLGNHEFMNIIGDLRYTDEGEFRAFADEETPQQRSAGFEHFQRLERAEPLDDTAARAEFDRKFPSGWFAHREAFSADGRYGEWLLRHDVVLILKHTLFVHAGLSPADAQRGVAAVNREIVEQARLFDAARDMLVDSGKLNPLIPFEKTFVVAAEGFDRLSEERSPVNNGRLAQAYRDYLKGKDAAFLTPDGPVWNAAVSVEDEANYAPKLEAVLGTLGVRRIVVGHRTQDDGRIGVRFGGRAFLIDTGAGPAYENGRVSALEINAQGSAIAVYPGERKTLTGPPGPSDEAIERILLEGEIVEAEYIGSGVTRPQKLTIELDGRKMYAAFKTVDEQKTGVTDFGDGRREVNFSDRYHYERAAYLLDRYLGIDMVPVAVLRTYKRQRGAVIQWISDAINENDRREQDVGPPNRMYLEYQRQIMFLFDALIYNTDRHLANELITTADWKLHLIDHSRAFRLNRELPENVAGASLTLKRDQFDRLQSMDEKLLRGMLKGLLNKAQIRALLIRRDLLVEKLEADRAEHGDEFVFQDLMSDAASPD